MGTKRCKWPMILKTTSNKDLIISAIKIKLWTNSTGASIHTFIISEKTFSFEISKARFMF
jgi:hypothetical protein